ncbi:hypothetical protein ACFWNT_14700, partial [Streptomyces sp. NPDC058409]|uniref:hypothetical protein n=1 Tax=Streptomyces sp. NPDC058409 TaxID=3346484 RepID=UPI003650F42D
MEPREFWDRNAVLAEAFCASDERMRLAQALLDEAQAERSRTLAAFAVTVGDDGSIADMMGLNEREVRLARRTVGRGDARTLAQELLNQPPATREAPAEPAPAPAPEIPVPHPREEMIVPPLDTPPPAPPPPSLPPVEMENTVVWSPSMDSVLLWSWESGLDVQTVAAELGLDVRALLMRVQELANDGLLTLATPVAEVSRSGRHRRQHEDGYAALFGPTTTFPTHVPY